MTVRVNESLMATEPGTTATTLVIQVPANPSGNRSATARIQVQTPTFTVGEVFHHRPEATTVSGVSPAAAAASAEVVIAGAGFVIGCVPYFGGSAATEVVVESASSIRCRVPPGSGQVDVRVDHPEGLTGQPLGGAFFYIAPPQPPAPLPLVPSAVLPDQVGRNRTFAIDVSLRQGGSVAPVTTDLTLELLDAGSATSWGPVTQTTASGATRFAGVVLGTNGTYRVVVRGSWGGPPAQVQLGTIDVLDPFSFTAAPTVGTGGGSLADFRVRRVGVGSSDPANTGTVTLSLVGNDGRATLSGTLTRALSGGAATFSGLSLDRAGRHYQVRARHDPTGEVVDAPLLLRIQAGAAQRLTFLHTPTTLHAGDPLGPRLEVGVLDGAGNLVRDESLNVTLSLDAHPSGAGISGTLTRPAVHGVAHFQDVVVDRAAAGLTLRARATGLADGTTTLTLAGPFLRLTSARASDGTTAGAGLDGDDEVVLVFDRPTSKPALTATNIDTALPLTGARTDYDARSWLSGDGSLGGASWSPDGTTLTVTLSTSGGAPNLKPNDRVSIGTVQSAEGSPGASRRFRIRGAFDGATHLYELDPYVLVSNDQVRFYGANFDSTAAQNTVSSSAASGESVVSGSADELLVDVGTISGGGSFTVTANGSTSENVSFLYGPYTFGNSVASGALPADARRLATGGDGIWVAYIRSSGALYTWARFGDHTQLLENGVAEVDLKGRSWIAWATTAGVIRVTEQLANTTFRPVEVASVDSSGTPLTGPCRAPGVSGDGRFVVFEADALPPGGTAARPGGPYVILRDRTLGTTTVISADPAGNIVGGRSPDVSADGRFVTFLADLDLTDDDTNGRRDAYAFDRLTSRLHLLSTDAAAADVAPRPTLGDSGRVVAYERNGDIYVHDRLLGANGVTVAAASRPRLSDDGDRLAFTSARTDLAPGWGTDGNNQPDTFLLDRSAGEIRPLSVSAARTYRSGAADHVVLSADGRVAFHRFGTAVELTNRFSAD